MSFRKNRSGGMLLALICLSTAVVATAADKAGAAKDLALFSWLAKDKTWHFVILPDPGEEFTDKKIMKTKGAVVGLDAIKLKIAGIPRGTVIVWRDGPPDHVLTYPPHAVTNELVAFAKLHGVTVEVLHTIKEAG